MWSVPCSPVARNFSARYCKTAWCVSLGFVRMRYNGIGSQKNSSTVAISTIIYVFAALKFNIKLLWISLPHTFPPLMAAGEQFSE